MNENEELKNKITELALFSLKFSDFTDIEEFKKNFIKDLEKLKIQELKKIRLKKLKKII